MSRIYADMLQIDLYLLISRCYYFVTRRFVIWAYCSRVSPCGKWRVIPTFGLLVLIIGDPPYIIIVMALWRLVLEFFIVLFRIAEDIHALRERGELV
jgi:hypothetical protein